MDLTNAWNWFAQNFVKIVLFFINSQTPGLARLLTIVVFSLSFTNGGILYFLAKIYFLI